MGNLQYIYWPAAYRLLSTADYQDLITDSLEQMSSVTIVLLINLISLGVFHMLSRPKGEALSCGTEKSEIITAHHLKDQTWNIILISLRCSGWCSRVASYPILY